MEETKNNSLASNCNQIKEFIFSSAYEKKFE